MNIQIHTGHNIQSTEALIAKFSSTITSALSKISDPITRVEVHLKDEDGRKKGKNDKRCLIEAHLKGRQPIVATDHADTLNQALNGAIHKLVGKIESIRGRQKNQKRPKIE